LSPGFSALMLGTHGGEAIEAALALRNQQRVDENQLCDPIRDRGGDALDNQPAITVANQDDARSCLVLDH
jgi:hypothetical protein